MLHPTDRPPPLREPRPAAGQDGEAELDEPAAHVAAERVVGVALGESRGAEHGHARANEVERAEAAQEVAQRARAEARAARDEALPAESRMGPLEEHAVRALGGWWWRVHARTLRGPPPAQPVERSNAEQSPGSPCPPKRSRARAPSSRAPPAVRSSRRWTPS